MRTLLRITNTSIGGMDYNFAAKSILSLKVSEHYFQGELIPVVAVCQTHDCYSDCKPALYTQRNYSVCNTFDNGRFNYAMKVHEPIITRPSLSSDDIISNTDSSSSGPDWFIPAVSISIVLTILVIVSSGLWYVRKRNKIREAERSLEFQPNAYFPNIGKRQHCYSSSATKFRRWITGSPVGRCETIKTSSSDSTTSAAAAATLTPSPPPTASANPAHGIPINIKRISQILQGIPHN